jgi:hypothetical protein
MELFDKHGAVTCSNIVPQKKGTPPLICVKRNNWVVVRSLEGYGTLIRCNHCEGVVRDFTVVVEGNKLKKF